MSSSIHHPETAVDDAAADDARPAATPLNSALYVVATPIGNLDDIGARALRVLRGADLIACEDTRKSKPMLRGFGIDVPCVAFHAHNEASMTERLLERLRDGQRIALISDAGTPAISDPGARLARAALVAGLRVTPIPGPSAVTTLASAAGFADGRFLFEGFLPTRSRQRRARIEALDAFDVAVVCFEAPHRIEETAADLLAVLGPDRVVVVGRELTKLFEQVVRLTLAEWPAWLAADPNRRRGEFVLGLHPRSTVTARDGGGTGSANGEGVDPAHDDGTDADAREARRQASLPGARQPPQQDAEAGDAPVPAGEPSVLGRKAMHILCETMPPRQAAKLAARISGDRADALYAFRVARRSTA